MQRVVWRVIGRSMIRVLLCPRDDVSSLPGAESLSTEISHVAPFMRVAANDAVVDLGEELTGPRDLGSYFLLKFEEGHSSGAPSDA